MNVVDFSFYFLEFLKTYHVSSYFYSNKNENIHKTMKSGDRTNIDKYRAAANIAEMYVKYQKTSNLRTNDINR